MTSKRVSIGRSVHAAVLGLGLAAVAFGGTIGGAHAAVDISSKPTKNMSCSAGVCSPTTRKAWLNTGDLANMLAASDIKVVTGAGATVIEVTAPLSWVSANRLTLDSARSIIFRREVTVAGPGGLTLVTNDGGSDGVLSFENKGRAIFWDLGSSLIVNGESLTLINRLDSLASAVAADPSGRFALADNYDATNDGVFAQSPVTTPFSGIFDGLGNAISNLRIESATNKNIGLFAELAHGGTIRDIAILKGYISMPSKYDGQGGFIVGYQSGGTLSRVAATGTIVSGVETGGLVGTNLPDATIVDSHANVSLCCGSNEGGLVGVNFGTIKRSFSTGSVSADGPAWLGGLAGGNAEDATVEESFATGKVSDGSYADQYSAIGGLVGADDGLIVNSYALARVASSGSGDNGGLVGYSSYVATLSHSYSTGRISAGKDSYVGGLLGVDVEDATEIIKSYWDLDTSGVPNPDQGAGNIPHDKGIRGLTTQEFQSGLPDKFDPTIWGHNLNINNGYPYLLANPPPQ